MSNSVIKDINEENWEYVIDTIFSQNQKNPAYDILIEILENNGKEIKEMYSEFNKKQTEDMLDEMRMHFPELSDYSKKPPIIDNYQNITKAVITAYYIREKIPEYYSELRKKVEELRNYLDGEDTKRGKNLYMDLTRGWNITPKKSKNWLNEATSDIDTELMDYDEEYEAYENRNVSRFGLTTNDAVKCLDDFEGRTFPFLRAICKKVDNDDKVIELGAGTGILSITAAIAGADSVIGLELNPITCILSGIIIDDLYRNGLLDRKESVNIVWGDALKFGRVEYKQYSDFTFDTVISENIYTGMFFELQMQMLSQLMDNKLVDVKRDIINGHPHRKIAGNVVPSSMASAAELIELENYDPDVPSEVLIDIQEKGHDISKKLTKPQPYDIMDYNIEEPSEILAKIRFKANKKGHVDAINIYSVVKLSDGDYITRNENEFLSNDHIIHLNESIFVNEGDELIVTIGFNESDSVTDGIFEVRKINNNNSIPENYDSRLNIKERNHEINKLKYKTKNNIKHDLDLYQLGDMEKIRCSSFYNGFEQVWRKNLKY